MNLTAALQKIIVWFTGLMIALFPIILGVTDNLTALENIIIGAEYARYFGELLFFSISLAVVALFDTMELISGCKKDENIIKTLFYIGFASLLMFIVSGAVYFGAYTPIQTKVTYLPLILILLLSCLIKFIHAIRENQTQ